MPAAHLQRPVHACRIALVTTAGLVPPGAAAFDLDRRGGDPTFRTIASRTDLRSLTLSHRSDAFDRLAVQQDPGVALPLEALRALVDERRVGEIAPRHLSFMGSITSPGRLVGETAPAGADLLVADAVDAVLLAPV